MGNKTERLFERDFIFTVGGRVRRGISLTTSTVRELDAQQRNLPLHMIGKAGMIVCSIKAVKDARRYCVANNSINRAIIRTYARAAESIHSFGPETSGLEQSVQRYRAAKAAYHNARNKGTAESIAKAKAMIKAERELAIQMRSFDSALFPEQRVVLERAKALETVLGRDGVINTSELLGTRNGQRIYRELNHLNAFEGGEVFKRAELMRADPKIGTSRLKKFWRSGGKSFIGFAAAYAMYEAATPNGEEIDLATVTALEDLYKSTYDAMEKIPDEFDYVHSREECAELVDWALKNTTNESEKEMFTLLKDKYNYNFYAYLKGEEGIDEEKLSYGELSDTVYEEMIHRLSNNANGEFYEKLRDLREARENTNEAERENEEASVSRTLAGVSNNPEQIPPTHSPVDVSDRSWQAEPVGDVVNPEERPLEGAGKIR